ncbi:MAG TPA: hypothetical protein VGD77_17970 [Gemmatimonadaceae bacterium]
MEVPKATPTFRPWNGVLPGDTYGGKAVLDVEGEPAFAELVILKLLERAGWSGVWIDTYRNKYRRAYWGAEPIAALPPFPASALQAILSKRDAGRSGTWDILAWNESELLFAESKRAGHDAIRPSQATWLAAALDMGHPLESFLVVEWSV